MTSDTWLLLSWIVVGAAVLVAHAVLVWQVLRSDDLPAGVRWWALVPVVTPVLAFKAGGRWSLAVWALLLLTYVVLRSLEG